MSRYAITFTFIVEAIDPDDAAETVRAGYNARNFDAVETKLLAPWATGGDESLGTGSYVELDDGRRGTVLCRSVDGLTFDVWLTDGTHDAVRVAVDRVRPLRHLGSGHWQ